MFRATLAIASAMTALVPLAAIAHPGHGRHPGDSLVHHLLDPAHAAILVPSLVLAVLLLVRRKRAGSPRVDL